MTELELYYNKFNEEKRLDSRHGQVEFRVSMKYIHEYIPAEIPKEEVKILDIGAGTGKYSVALAKEGYDALLDYYESNGGTIKETFGSVSVVFDWGEIAPVYHADQQQISFTVYINA